MDNYYLENKETRLNYQKEYNLKNKEQVQKYQTEYQKRTNRKQYRFEYNKKYYIDRKIYYVSKKKLKEIKYLHEIQNKQNKTIIVRFL